MGKMALLRLLSHLPVLLSTEHSETLVYTVKDGI